MKNISFILFSTIALVLIGAGCSSSTSIQTSDADRVATDTSATAVVAVPTMTPDVVLTAATSSSDLNATTTKPMSDTSKKPSALAMVLAKAELAFPGVLPALEVNQKIRIKTNLGDIVIQLNQEQGPNAASNFIYLVSKGFYNGTIFHRVIPGFMIQGGDPTGTGTSGPGYRFADDPVKASYEDGTVAMANAGPNTNGSQFFIMVANVPLPPNYSIFGKVVSGLEVAHKIADVARDRNDRPLSEVKMISVSVEE